MRHFLLALSCCLLLASCLPGREAPPSAELAPRNQALVVLPVEPIPGTTHTDEQRTRLAAGAALLDELLAEHFAARPDTNLVSEVQKEAIIGLTNAAPPVLARLVGERLRAGLVLMMHVTDYRQRQGTTYSVIEPAAIGFTYQLIDTETGASLCNGKFDQAQQSAFENLLDFSLKRSLRWMDVREFAADALKRKFAGCPYLAAPAKQ